MKIHLFLDGQAHVPTFDDIPIPRIGEHVHYQHTSYRVTMVEYNLDEGDIDVFTTIDL